MAIYIVVGISGCGKGTVIKKMLEKEKGYEVCVFSHIMRDICEEKGLELGLDDFRHWQKTHRVEYTKMMSETGNRIIKLAEGKNLIIDTHATLKGDAGYFPGLPEWLIKRLNPKLLILVVANPANIKERQARDEKARKRIRSDFGTVEGVAEFQEIERIFTVAAAEVCDAPVKIIKNEEGEADKAAKELAEVLKG